MSSAAEASPPWVELPREITATILHKLGAIEILTAAQGVCTAWHGVCQDPSMWRCVDIRNVGDPPYNLDKMCRHAVDRSQGQLTDINFEYFGNYELLMYISQRSSQLRRLRLVLCFNITGDGLLEAVKRLPLLEELHLYYTYTRPHIIEAVGRSCPQLKSFTLNGRWYRQEGLDYDGGARAIAESMPQLCHLRLFGNRMTNQGLQAILDGCPHLESLDLRQCFNLRFGGSIRRLCTQRIRDLRCPSDSTHDYPFGDHQDLDDYFITGFFDIEIMSDYHHYR